MAVAVVAVASTDDDEQQPSPAANRASIVVVAGCFLFPVSSFFYFSSLPLSLSLFHWSWRALPFSVLFFYGDATSKTFSITELSTYCKICFPIFLFSEAHSRTPEKIFGFQVDFFSWNSKPLFRCGSALLMPQNHPLLTHSLPLPAWRNRHCSSFRFFFLNRKISLFLHSNR